MSVYAYLQHMVNSLSLLLISVIYVFLCINNLFDSIINKCMLFYVEFELVTNLSKCYGFFNLDTSNGL